MAKAGKRLTKDEFDKLVSTFLDHGPIFARVAVLAGVSIPTARLAWEKGSKHLQQPPIKVTHQQFQLAARAQLEEKQRQEALREQQDREKAKTEAIRARAEEGLIVQGARRQLMPMLATINELSRNLTQLVYANGKDPSGGAGIAMELFEHEAAKLRVWMQYEQALLAGNPMQLAKPQFDKPSMSLEELARYAQRIAYLQQHATVAAREAFKLHRQYLGEPTDIIRHVDDQTVMSTEEADIKMQNAQKVWERFRTKDGEPGPELTVLPGGKAG